LQLQVIYLSENEGARATLTPSEDAFDAAALLSPLQALLTEVHTVWFQGDLALCSAFGASLWPWLGEQLVERGSFSSSDLPALEALEEELLRLGFIETRPTCLCVHARSMQQSACTSACVELLGRGRQILLDRAARSQPNEGRVSERSSINEAVFFAFPPCQTSRAAEQLVSVIEVCFSLLHSEHADDTSALGIVVKTVHQLLELFRATASIGRPSLDPESAWDAGPGPAALLHNDCMLLAHRLLSIGFEQPRRGQSSGGDTDDQLCSFVSRAPEFRALAKRVLDGYTARVLVELAEHFAEADAFAELWVAKRAAKTTQALTKLLYELERLGAIWRAVLPWPCYALALGGLVGKVAGWVVAAVIRLAQDDLLCFKPEGLEALYEALTLFRNSCPPIFAPPELSDGGGDGEEACGAAGGSAWLRFCALYPLLKPEYKDFRAIWQSGKLASLSAAECVSVLRALAVSGHGLISLVHNGGRGGWLCYVGAWLPGSADGLLFMANHCTSISLGARDVRAGGG
jgi:hypothetical protein